MLSGKKDSSLVQVVWFSWKDRWHPKAGGAESVSGEIMDRLARDGHSVTLFTACYANSKPFETINGVQIYRTGGTLTVYLLSAFRYFRHKKPYKKVDVLIDEMNTIPFFAGLFVRSSRKILLSYQLAREVWFYQTPPIVAQIGYILEYIYLRLIPFIYGSVLTESISSKIDMERHGMKNIDIFPVGLTLKPLERLEKKQDLTTILSLGSVRRMKQTIDILKAFEAMHAHNPKLRLIIAGDLSGSYGTMTHVYAQQSPAKSHIVLLGRVSPQKRLELMRNAAVIVVTSVKEGWGLIVTEANSQGTPAVVYDVDGLRDSVKDGVTGAVSKRNVPVALSNAVRSVICNQEHYETLRYNAWQWSKDFTLEESYRLFCKSAKIT